MSGKLVNNTSRNEHDMTVVCMGDAEKQRALADGFTEEDIVIVSSMTDACNTILG